MRTNWTKYVYHFRVCVLLYIASLCVLLSWILSNFEDKLNLSCAIFKGGYRFKPLALKCWKNYTKFRRCKNMLQNIWRLEHGRKLLKCQEKPYGVYKMLENAWWLLWPDPAGGAYSAPHTSIAGAGGGWLPHPQLSPLSSVVIIDDG